MLDEYASGHRPELDFDALELYVDYPPPGVTRDGVRGIPDPDAFEPELDDFHDEASVGPEFAIVSGTADATVYADLEELERPWPRPASPIRARVCLNKRRAPGNLTAGDWIDIVVAYEGRCAYCGVRGARLMEHVVPASRGGATSVNNMVPACAWCNNSKGARDPIEWKGDNPEWWEQFMARRLAAEERFEERQRR